MSRMKWIGWVMAGFGLCCTSARHHRGSTLVISFFLLHYSVNRATYVVVKQTVLTSSINACICSRS